MNKIKALSLVFFAIAAMSAVTASAAQAGDIELAKVPATITGINSGSDQAAAQLSLEGGGFLQFTCTTQRVEATATTKTVQELQITATYEGCKANGVLSVVRMNGCKFTMTGEGLPFATVNVDITGCTAGKQVEVEQVSSGCIVVAPEQNNLEHVVLTQQGNDATVDITIEKITVTQSAKCPIPSVHQQNATFKGSTTIQAFEDQGTTGPVTKHGHQYTEHKHNNVEIKITVK